MDNHEQAVRDAAAALKTAIESATAAGYRVHWPGRAADLDRIEISGTARVVTTEPAKPAAPQTFGRTNE